MVTVNERSPTLPVLALFEHDIAHQTF